MSHTYLIAAGGTGGHVYPALAIAGELRSLDESARIHFVGGRRGIEGRLVPRAGYSITRLPSAGLRGLGAAGALRFALSFSVALLATLPLVMRMRPDVVLATGGYASAAPAVAAAVLGVPLWLQEQNAVPGSTNRFLSRFAERAYCAFEEASPFLSRARRTIVLPNPVRREILESATSPRTDADYEAFGLSPARPTVLVFGGSRGSATLNRAVRKGWPGAAAGTRWQALVQTGEAEAEDTEAYLREAMEGAPGTDGRTVVLPYIDDMATAYRVADLVVCRAGALTLAELGATGIPSMLVPYPYATDDHQMKNARAVEATGAARVVSDDAMDGSVLTEALIEFDENPAVLETMGEAAAELAAGHNGAAELAAALLSRAEGGSPS